jgi:hypothetical protein
MSGECLKSVENVSVDKLSTVGGFLESIDIFLNLSKAFENDNCSKTSVSLTDSSSVVLLLIELLSDLSSDKHLFIIDGKYLLLKEFMR